ncbi:MAG: class I SAM-dependent methyltransferase [Firmicutes bacterium]|nr:class I SAM-dependent methyltransferase [Bacillota bacterium]
MALRPRLAMTADLVPPGVAVADIGSDHAYLPVHLVRAGICPRAIASDIGEGPLENARKSVQRAGLEHQIELRLSDGFRRFAAADASCWVLAGMGGTLMARLLEAAPWLCAPGTVIVAQPMRRAEELRAWLVSHGFRIERESACRDAGRAYLALRARFDGISRAYPPGYIYYGELLHNHSQCAREILARELKLLETIVNCQPSTANCQKRAYDDFRARCV